MKALFTSIYIVNIIFLFTIYCFGQSDKDNTARFTSVYFPVNSGKTIVYTSSFGKSSTKYFEDGDRTISLSEGDDFEYKQTLIIKSDGVYLKETYQYFKIFLFLNSEETIKYSKPLLRFPLPLLPGDEWDWEGEEISESETNKIIVKGKVLSKEIVITKAGKLEAIKIETIIESADGAKNIVSEWFTEGLGLIKAIILIDGGGLMGFIRDVLGYGSLEFEITEIRMQ